MTTFTGGAAQNNVFNGSSGSDVFVFNVADLDGNDIVAGNGGTDTLVLNGVGTLTPASFAGVSSIEVLTLANGGISLAFSDAAASGFAGSLLVNGSSGDDTVDYSAVTLGTRSINVIAGIGNDTFLGGFGYDIFHFNIADLTAADHVSGGGGSNIDQFYFDTAGTITAANLAGVSGIERYLLANGTNSITFNVANATGIYNNTIQVFGNAGNDTIDATGITTGAHLDTTSGGGLDTIRGSSGDDVFRFAAGDLAGDTVNGYTGYDSLIITGTDALTTTDLAAVANIEQITLQGAGSSVTLNNAIATANTGILAIYGTSGNDTVDASAVTLTTRSVLVTALGGSDTLRGGLGYDSFRFNPTDLDSTDIVSGGGGSLTDAINFLTAGTVAAAAFTGVSGIERLTFVAGTNGVTVNDVLVSTAYNQLLTIYGNTGNDTFDASALTGTNRIEVYASGGNDKLLGGAGNDLFRFSVDALDANDTVTGGAGYDELNISNGGQLTSARLAGVSGIEQITFSVPGLAVTLNNTVAAANATALTLYGSTGNDIVDASAVTDTTHGINFVAFAGNDTAKGGLAADVFRFTATDLTASDIVSGGSGASVDTLQITAAGTVAASAFAQVTGIEAISMNIGGINLALSNALVSSANGQAVTVYGSTGDDTFDASAVTSVGNRIDFSANTGNDTFIGSAGNDIVRIRPNDLTSADTLAGGAGSDSLLLNLAGGAALGSNITGFEVVTLAVGGINVSITDAFLANNVGDFRGSTGNDIFNATTTTIGMSITGGGGGNDTIITGTGADTIVLTPTELTSADSIDAGSGGGDILRFTGTVSLTAAASTNVVRIERVELVNGTNSLAISNGMATSADGALLTVVGGTGNDTLDTSAVVSPGAQIDFQAGSGTDTLIGGIGSDIFTTTAADLTAADTVSAGGGSGVDTVRITTGGAVGSTAGITGVEIFTLSAAGNSLVLNNATVTSANIGLVTVNGGAGNDTIDASAVGSSGRLFTQSGAGNDTLIGGAGNDQFQFAPGDLTAADSINGGSGFDVLAFTSNAAVIASQLAGTSGLEQITLGGTGASIILDNAAVANNAATLQVLGTTGNDTIDASAVSNAARGITVIANTGNDTLKGGAGADTFQLAVSYLTAADTIVGGGGSANDTLQFLTAGTITAANMAGVSGIETYQLADGANSIVLADAQATSAYDKLVKVIGGTGNDIINAGAVTSAGARADISAGSGVDTLIGSNGNDIFRFALTGGLTTADSVSGGTGSDSLSFSGGGALDLTGLSNVTSIETIQLDNNAHSVVVDDTLVYNADNHTVTVNGGTGVDTLDVSRVVNSGNVVVFNAGDGDDVLIESTAASYGPYPGGTQGDLGAGNDTLYAAAGVFDATGPLSGGTGTDTIVLDYGVGSSVTLAPAVTGFEVVNLVNSGSGGYTGYFTANDTPGLTVTATSALLNWAIQLGNGGQTANGNALADMLVGGAGADTLRGYAGNDTIDGLGGADVVDAGDNDDAVRYYGAATSIAGGNGNDTLYVLNGGVINLSVTADQSIGDTAVVTGFENVNANNLYNVLTGTVSATIGATITGTSAANVIEGSDYDDVIDGNGGADRLYGDSGTDRITYRGTETAINGYYASYTSGDVAQNDTLVMLAGANVNLASSGDQTTGDTVGVYSFQNVDASAVTTNMNLNGDVYDNTLLGGSGVNAITGQDGNDTIDGGAGADSLYGGNGNDRIWYDAADTVTNAGADIDTLLIRTAANINLAAGDQGVGDTGTMTGFENADASLSTAAVTLRGSNSYMSTLTGGSGADTIVGGTAGAYLYGGAGDDAISAAAGSSYNEITGGAGKDTLIGGNGQDVFYFNPGDVVTGESVNGGSGSNIAYVNGDADFSGGYKNISYTYLQGANNTNVTLTLTGADLAALSGQQIYARPDSDNQTVETVIAQIASGTTVNASGVGFQWFQGNDRLVLNGSAGNETIITPFVNVTVNAGAGNDTIQVSPSYQYWQDGSRINGEAGNDRIDYGYNVSSNAVLDGGADSDTLFSSYPSLSLTVDLRLADQTVGDTTTVQNFENLDWTGQSGALSAIGTTGANTINGGEAADTIDGLGGADTINGNGGDDTITYRSDATLITGGSGTDKLIVTGAANINLAAADQGVGDTGSMTGFENVDASTSSVAVTLRGSNAVASTLSGGSAADTIVGGTAGAYLYGGAGDDTISAAASSSYNEITGGAGKDTLLGGNGQDIFYFNVGDVAAGETANGGAGSSDAAYFYGDADFTAGSYKNIETTYLLGGTSNLTLKLTGADLAGLAGMGIDANYTTDATIETVIAQLASGSTNDFSAVNFSYFSGSDRAIVNGAAGNETVTAAYVATTINAGAGNDTLRAANNYWADHSLINGEAGNDRIAYGYNSSVVDVTLDGGADTDTLISGGAYYAYADATFDLRQADQSIGDTLVVKNFENLDWSGSTTYGTLTVTGTTGANVIYGGETTDTIDGYGGADTINGYGGDDRITYRSDATLLAGGDGTDTLVVLGAANINLAASDQGVGDTGSMTGFENVDASAATVAVTLRGSNTVASILTGGSAGDTITLGDVYGSQAFGGGGNDTITGGNATDNITGGAGADTLSGGAGNDNFYIYAGDFVAGESINGGADYDYLNVAASTDFTVGTLSQLESLSLAATDGAGNHLQQDVAVVLTGAQAAGLSAIYASPYADTTETLTINVASGTSVDLSGIGFGYFAVNDSIIINGAAGNETITAAGIASTINAGAGNDTVLLGTYNAWTDQTIVNGGAGNDRIAYGYSPAGNIVLDGGTDTDTIIAGSNYYYYTGITFDLRQADQSGSDGILAKNFENIDWSGSTTYGTLTVTGTTGANVIYGGENADILDGYGGADSINGYGGDDRITYRADATLLVGGDGNDTLVVVGSANINLAAADQGVGDTGTTTGFENVDASASTVAVTLRGSDTIAGTLIGGSAGDTITGGGINDIIIGGGGADTLSGGAGNDSFYLGSGDFVSGESINGGADYDFIFVGANTNFSVGTLTGIDEMRLAPVDAAGNALHQDISVILTGTEAAQLSTLYAGYYFSDTIDTVTINVASGTTVNLGSLNLYNFQAGDSVVINGAAGNETIIAPSVDGGGWANIVHGNDGTDTLQTGALGHWTDNSSIYGDAGNDRIDYGSNNTYGAFFSGTLDGGADVDTLVLTSYLNGATLDLSAADQSSGDSFTVKNFENIDGSNYGYGLTATGSSVANTLLGGSGNDTLNGGAGNDTIDGGANADTLTGGTGQDTFRWSTRDDTIDTITDFSSVDDTLQFASSQYHFNGAAFDIAVNDTTGHVNIGSADLIRYTGGVLNSTSDVYSYLAANATGATAGGVFVLGVNSSGETVLYHVGDPDLSTGGDIVAVADFGTSISPATLSLSDFAFFAG